MPEQLILDSHNHIYKRRLGWEQPVDVRNRLDGCGLIGQVIQTVSSAKSARCTYFSVGCNLNLWVT